MTMGNTTLLLLLAVLMLCLIPLCSSCVERERRALLSFKRSLIDPAKRLSNWVGQNCCEWDGVACNNKTAHVVQLDLANPHTEWSDDNKYFVGMENSSLVGREVDPSLMELKHLEWLDLSFNNFAGSEIPKFIGNFTKLRGLFLSGGRFEGAVPASLGNLSKLEILDLSFNSLTGVVPASLGNLSKLEVLDLEGNSLTGVVSEIFFERLSRLDDLNLGDNSLVFKISSNWTPPFQLSFIFLHSCLVGPRFPHWLRNQSRIFELSLPNASISDSIPEWFPNIASNFHWVDLSHNQIHGLVPDLSRNTTNSLFSLDLSSNNLEGPLPPFPSNTQIIYLSDNFISRSLPQNISDMMPNLLYLDLRKICDLLILRLSNNKLYGEIPSALKKCQHLEIFDIGENRFSGNIPSWIGQLSNLTILSLRSNKLEGCIVPELCRIKNIRILDLAKNKFSGTIPPCFKNFTGMKLGHKLWKPTQFSALQELKQDMKGRELIYTSTLSFLVNLDLSSNNLHGLIPKELTLLIGLCGLNLSHNQLTGEIPKEIGNLRLLESLDFSNNLLTGVIPQSISELTSISYLDLSNNNLFGRIPTGHQLQTFEPWIYRGNPNLCGVQIEKLCPEDKPLPRNDADNQVKDEDFEMVWFYISMIIGFVVGFWGVWGVLFCKKAWRATYFRFVENVHDLVLVKVKQICRA